MRHAKSRGGSGVGVVGLTQNCEAYQRWVSTTHERVKYVQRTLDMVYMVQADDFGTQHRDLRSSSISKNEDSAKRTMAAVNCFTNPFVVDAKTDKSKAFHSLTDYIENVYIFQVAQHYTWKRCLPFNYSDTTYISANITI